MRFAILGSGAVGGYYGAKLVRAGYSVKFLARGAHLEAMRERGLAVRSVLGDFTVRVEAHEDPAAIGHVDVVIVAIKTYDNAAALPSLRPMVNESTAVLTLQNGIESVGEVAAIVGSDVVLGGATYVATALLSPGVIEQTGTHRRIVFGEVFGECVAVSERVTRIADAFVGADIEVEAVADARVRLWEKLIYLAPFAAVTGAARLPIGATWGDPDGREVLLRAVTETEQVARAEGIAVAADILDQTVEYLDAIPAATRSSLLIDLAQGKRIEVEALQGSVVRRGRALGVPTPMMSALYAVLKPHAGGAPALSA